MNYYYYEDDCKLDEFRVCVERKLTSDDVPYARSIEKNIPIYDMSATEISRELMIEWAKGLRSGTGIIVLKNAYQDTSSIDQATEIFNQIIAEEETAGKGAGDHFAKAGANSRIWNSLQKLCEKSPEVFARYHGNANIDAVARAWLGPAYQMTAQVNVVRPGGSAQQAHRDYHLGFMTAEQSSDFPAHAHEVSPVLTLQGAIVHIDTPFEAGPTKLLPFSQNYQPGYAAWRRDDFRTYFEANYVQLPLEKGDAVFFNPAVFHAAGANTSKDIHRLVNLLQISSAMGRAMESVDRFKMCKLVYPELSKLDKTVADCAINACAEGYSFPTNLDRDPPIGGLAPKTQADILREGLAQNATSSEINQALDALMERQKP